MLYWGLLLCSATALVWGDQEIHVKPGENWSSAVQSQGYPEPPASRDAMNEKWVLTTEPGNSIKVFCLDFRFVYDPNEPCKYGSMSFDDGTNKITKCGVQDGIIVKSTDNKLTVELETSEGGGGIFDCRAKAVGDPSTNAQSFEISSGEEEKNISVTGDGKERSESWVIKSKSGEPVYVRCDLKLEDGLHTGECSKDVITVNNGEQTKEYCGYKPLYVESKTGQITLTAELFDGSEGSFNCLTGVGEDNPTEKRLDLEDSSEHGVAPGAKGTTCECGKANKDYGRVLNGTETLEGEYPFMVSLREPFSGRHFCGASIITPRHILTAAHCVSNYKIKNKPSRGIQYPVVGAHYRRGSSSHGKEKRLTVKDIYIHDTWFDRKISLVGDIAVIVLDKPLTYNKYVSPVCMSSKPLPIVNHYIRLMGWGRTEDQYGGSPVLKHANVFVLDTKKCNGDERETCIRYGPTASCFEDSGGPYVYLDPETNRYTQAALVSYGIGNCAGPYSVGTNVVYYHDWIKEIVKATSDESLCMKID